MNAPITGRAGVMSTALDRFSRGDVGVDLAGLGELYRSWCRQVSFDNALRFISLKAGDSAYPGADPGGFWSDWLRTGCGGMCVPTALGLGSLLSAHGFRWRHALAIMDDASEANHVTTVVTLPSGRFLLDTVGLGEAPVPLDTVPREVGDGPLHVHSRPVGDGWDVRWSSPVNRSEQRCLVSPGAPLPDLSDFYRRTQASSTFEQFNEMLYARVNTGSGIAVAVGGFAVVVDHDGEVRPAERSSQELLASVFGWSEAVITQLERVGAFE